MAAASRPGPPMPMTGVGVMYLAKVRQEVPLVNQKIETSDPFFADTVDAFREVHKDDPEVLARLQNKVLVCSKCGKPCAYTLKDCNACGTSLSGIAISFNDNCFMGFVYGISSGRFPYKISMRLQSPEILCFDDPLSLSVCHLNSIPTDVYVPDLRYLFMDPARGYALVNKMYDTAASAALEQFWKNDEFRAKYFGNEPVPADVSDLNDIVLCGMNFPPSMYQLHLQFIHPPMLPFQYAQAIQENHFHYGRFFPLDYLRKALSLGDSVKIAIDESTEISDIIQKINEYGVNYDEEQIALLRKCKRIQERFNAWKRDDFDCIVANGEVLGSDGDARAIQAEDVKRLQNYGRPYNETGKPSGTYYKFAKKPSEVASWPLL